MFPMPVPVQVSSIAGQSKGGTHNQMGITKIFTNLKGVFNTAQQLVSQTNSFFLSVHYFTPFLLSTDFFHMNVQQIALPQISLRELSHFLRNFYKSSFLAIRKKHASSYQRYIPSYHLEYIAFDFSICSQVSALFHSPLNRPRLISPENCE